MMVKLQAKLPFCDSLQVGLELMYSLSRAWTIQPIMSFLLISFITAHPWGHREEIPTHHLSNGCIFKSDDHDQPLPHTKELFLPGSR